MNDTSLDEPLLVGAVVAEVAVVAVVVVVAVVAVVVVVAVVAGVARMLPPDPDPPPEIPLHFSSKQQVASHFFMVIPGLVMLQPSLLAVSHRALSSDNTVIFNRGT